MEEKPAQLWYESLEHLGKHYDELGKIISLQMSLSQNINYIGNKVRQIIGELENTRVNSPPNIKGELERAMSELVDVHSTLRKLGEDFALSGVPANYAYRHREG